MLKLHLSHSHTHAHTHKQTGRQRDRQIDMHRQKNKNNHTYVAHTHAWRYGSQINRTPKPRKRGQNRPKQTHKQSHRTDLKQLTLTIPEKRENKTTQTHTNTHARFRRPPDREKKIPKKRLLRPKRSPTSKTTLDPLKTTREQRILEDNSTN